MVNMGGYEPKSITRREFARGAAAGVCTLGLAGCASPSEESPQDAKKEPGKLAIICTNDVHGHVLLNDESLGYAAVAQLRNDWEEKGYEVLVMDCGDAAQGAPIVGRSNGDNAISFMNEVGYDVMVLGNHEFDYGQDKIEDYVNAATFPIISANIIVNANKTNLVAPRTTLTLKDGRKVGVFGLTTPATRTTANPLFIEGLTFYEDQELYDCAQEQIDELTNSGCDLIVCLGHLGEDEASAPNRAQDVVANTSGIHLFLDGHDHKEENQTFTDAKGNETLVVESDCYTHMVGVVTWEDGKLDAQFVKIGEYDGQDKTVAAAIQTVADEVGQELGEVIATTPFKLNGERVPGLRNSETNLGDLVADALLWQAQISAEDYPDAALINSGGLRTSIEEGDITLGSVNEVMPFINYLCTAHITGTALLEALEASCQATPEELGGFPQVAGIKFTIDTTVPYEKGEVYPGSTYHAPANPGARVTIESVNELPFDEGATYTIAAPDFVCVGGDTYYAFAASAKDSLRTTGHTISDVICNYLKEMNYGAVGYEYANPQGRITIIS